jgi:hypothetical protein
LALILVDGIELVIEEVDMEASQAVTLKWESEKG